MSDTAVTIEMPGHPPIHTTDKQLHQAAERLVRDAGGEPAVRFAKDQLRAIVERIERLEEEKKGIADDIKDVYAEAKGNGYDTKALRTVIRLRKQDKDERAEQEAILDTYLAALGMI